GFRDLLTGVTTVSRANLREGTPSTQARITAVLEEGAFVTVAAFTETGERVNGNACWYRTDDGNYLWAGATSEPHPVGTRTTAVAPAQLAAVSPSRPGTCGIARIDQMIAGIISDPIAQTETDRDAIAVVQDLLTGHGFGSLPGLLSPQRGIFGSRTVQAITDFQ